MRRVLILASVASMIDQFNMPNIKLLLTMGYAVDVACNFEAGNTCSDERIEDLKQRLKILSVHSYQIDFARDITNLVKNIRAFWQVEYLLEKNDYEFIHCHSPIGGVAGRFAGRKKHIKVIYTAHGFHFYKGAPLKNWLMYYPVEKICSYITDTLICINKEDFALAQKRMKAVKIEYIPGIGIDLEKFAGRYTDRNRIKYSDLSKAERQIGKISRMSGEARKNQFMDMIRIQRLRESIGVDKEKFLLLSVGELNENKNHSVVIKALRELERQKESTNIHYIIIGKGKQKKKLQELSKEYGIAEKIHILGFRNDVSDWYQVADVFVFPSKREGLSVSLMEAMASGMPVICSRIRGNIDLIDEGKGGFYFESDNPLNIANTVKKVMSCNIEKIGRYNVEKMKRYDLKNVMCQMKKIYAGE